MQWNRITASLTLNIDSAKACTKNDFEDVTLSNDHKWARPLPQRINQIGGQHPLFLTTFLSVLPSLSSLAFFFHSYTVIFITLTCRIQQDPFGIKDCPC